MIFRARQFEFVFPRPALVMGVVNVTPDSFSDGGKFLDAEPPWPTRWNWSRRARKSSTSAANPRVPAPNRSAKRKNCAGLFRSSNNWPAQVQHPAFPIDTMKPAVARAALAAGASIVNDVAANREDDAMWKVVAEFQRGLHLHARAAARRKRCRKIRFTRMSCAKSANFFRNG